MNYRIMFAAGAIALVSVSGAQAADLIVPPTPVSFNSLDVPVTIDDWTGFYVGADLGGVTTDDFSETNSAWLGGVQAGYLYQSGIAVFGAELGANWHDALQYELTPTGGLQQDWSVEATGRGGVALDNTLIYGAAGVSLTEFAATGNASVSSDTHAGLVLGLGVEQKLGNGWSARAEYTQTNYWDVASVVDGVSRADDLTNHAVTVGVNYRF